jgi:hypothetical protein
MTEETGGNAEVAPIPDPPSAGTDGSTQTPIEVEPAGPVPGAPPPPTGVQRVEDKGKDKDEELFDSGAVAADSLRVTVGVAKEIFGDAVDTEAQERDDPRHYTTNGPTNIGDHGTIHNHVYAGRLRKPIIRDLPHVAEMVRTYAPASADVGLDRALDRRSTACLTGPADTGRYTTACSALARRRDAAKVHEILLPLNEGPECIERNESLLAAGHGYVLRLPGDGHTRAMRLLDDVFRRTGCSLVLVKDSDQRGGALSSAEVAHCKPSASEVFSRHLAKLLQQDTPMEPDAIAAYVARCRHWKDLQAMLAKTYGPREVIAIAREVARVRPDDDDAMAAVLAVSQPERRARASRALLPSAPGERWSHHRTGQHERAFRISYAAFCHQPLHDVFTATGWLLEEIDGESRRPDLGRLALEHPISELLGPELSADWRDAQEEAAPIPGTSRAAWLRDTAMRGAILDVAWHEFDNTRPALIHWLARLVREGEKPMQAAAAEVAGLLASHDFDRVHDELIDPWAASPRRDVRQAAARTAVLAAYSGQVAVLVRRKVREWVDSGSHKRDTALRVYATGLLQPYLGWNLVDLHRIAGDRLQRRSHLIAEAVNQLYTPERLGWLVSEVADWVRVGRTGKADLSHPHAALAFLALAARSEDLGTLPEMLLQLGTAEVSVADVVPLWRTALLDGRSSGAGWARLGEWLRHADIDESLRKATGNMLGELAQQPPLRRRLEFSLRHEWDGREGVPAWITTAMRG